MTDLMLNIRTKDMKSNKRIATRHLMQRALLICGLFSTTLLFFFPGVQSCCEAQKEVSSPAADSMEVVPGSQLLWRIVPRPANSAQV